jgi:adenylate kinase
MEPTIALLGPPGSGKGTQAARLRDDLGFTTLASGELLRAARAAGTELGRRAAAYMDRGDLVPDDLIVGIVLDALADAGDTPVLLDGFPRNVEQAEALAENGRELSAAILIDVPDDVVERRILGRRQGRSDDNPETVRERLRVYHQTTEPLTAYYRDRGLLRTVDGCGDPDDVYERVCRSAQER